MAASFDQRKGRNPMPHANNPMLCAVLGWLFEEHRKLLFAVPQFYVVTIYELLGRGLGFIVVAANHFDRALNVAIVVKNVRSIVRHLSDSDDRRER
jgi:hypothetical protein